MRKPRKTKAMMTLGPGVVFVSEDYLLEHLEPFGVTRRGFRDWLRKLRVPIVWRGNTATINLIQYKLAETAASRVGQPDIAMPGSEPIRKGISGGCVTGLDPEYLRANLVDILIELIESRRLAGLDPRKAVRDIQLAAFRILEIQEQTKASRVQQEYQNERVDYTPIPPETPSQDQGRDDSACGAG